MMNVKKCAGFQIFLHIFLGILGGSKMDFPDYLNVDCSEDDADDAAELEAHLYSKIYSEEEEQGTDATQATTSVRLYTENEVLSFTEIFMFQANR